MRGQHFADKLVSSPGKHDGLYWPSAEGKPESPLGPGVGGAVAEGYTLEKGKLTPYHGYHYRILTAQGPHAPGGAINHVVKGKLYGGFAFVAYPATYGASGVMSFIVDYSGDVLQKDLGEDTAALAKSLKRFDPDPSWKPAQSPP